MDFRQLGLIGPILKALDEQGYSTPTPIQRGAIPPALKGRDVLGCAQTGTGKTCAFSTPILQRLHQAGKSDHSVIRALVLTPTRELAIQIGESFAAYGARLPLRTAVIFGGVGQQPQVDKLKAGVDILVATPGRLLDLHGQNLLDLSHIEIFVLDEADRMLDMGFIHDVRRVLKVLPRKKQTLFFSATMPPEVMELVNTLLHDYARVAVDPISSPVEVIRQSLYFVDKSNKTNLLAHLIEQMNMDSVLVFSRTKHGANRIANDLLKRNIPAAAIHGNKSQTARQQALADFKAGKVRALVATDIAARGIDIDELKWVVNYDLPEVAETYVHRIGRTGRAGHDGCALSFCRADEKDYLKQIEKLLGRKLPVVQDHPFPMIEAATGVDPMTQARREGKENARARAAERRKAQAEKLQAEKTAPAAPVLTGSDTPSSDAPSKKKKRKKKKSSSPAAVPPSEGAERATCATGETKKAALESKKGHFENKKTALEEQKNAPKLEKSPVSTPANPVERSSKHPAEQSVKKSKRGVRQGDLSATLPSAPSMPTVDFVRPNPLDSDVIMDATARLLAPRKPIYSQPKPAPAKAQPASVPAKGQAKPAPAKNKAKSAPAKGQNKSPSNKSRRPHSDPPRAHAEDERRGSIMKPYYLNDD